MALSIGVVGYGYWGPNIARNIEDIDGAELGGICDLDTELLSKARSRYPGILLGADHREITESTDLDAVAVVTPVNTHYEIARSALEHGKHVFVEKPFTASADQADELIELASRNNLTIMVDHTFLFTGAVRKIKDIVASGQLGDVLYFDSTRVNLGLFQHDINVVWDLAPHDLSIMDHVVGKKALAIAAHGIDHFGGNLENIAFITLYCEDDFIAHFNVNWLSPVKIRKTLIGGSEKMLVWDDTQADEKIKIYDKGVSVDSKESIRRRLVSYREGDAQIPKIDSTEALRMEIEYFIECVGEGKTPVNDGNAGLRVVRCLEAAQRSIDNQGQLIELGRI